MQTPILINDTPLFTEAVCVIAGPCAIESEAQIHRIAAEVAAAGATVLRGGAHKPRTSPHSFQGIGAYGYQLLQEAAQSQGLWSIAEVIDEASLAAAYPYIDIIQIGARNMQNFSLLKAVSAIDKPVLLKRGLAATYKEWLSAAEYILHGGNQQVILCERGIRSFETTTRNTLDLAAVPMLRSMTTCPIVVDPSHATGKRALIEPMTLAAVAAGADGVMIETHFDPDSAPCDAEQTIDTRILPGIIQRAQAIRSIASCAL